MGSFRDAEPAGFLEVVEEPIAGLGEPVVKCEVIQK